MMPLAHSDRGSGGHGLAQHLHSTALRTATFASVFGAAAWGEVAGRWHDLGKFSPAFQRYLQLAGDDAAHAAEHAAVARVDHSTAGAIHAADQLRAAGQLLAYAIAGHHAGLPDWESLEAGRSGLKQRLRNRPLLQKESIPATFFYPAVSAMLHPEEVRGIAGDGHEIGIHSWIHEVNTTLTREAERDLTFRAAETLAKIAGRDPVGMRTASWDFSVNTLDIIRELRLLYDSSLMADDDPYELTDAGAPTGIVELPPEWIRDDAVYFNFLRFSALRPYTPPSAVEEIFTAEFDGAWEESGLFLLTMHPHVTGHRSRLPLLARLIRHMKARGKCWFATHAQVAQWCKDNA